MKNQIRPSEILQYFNEGEVSDEIAGSKKLDGLERKKLREKKIYYRPKRSGVGKVSGKCLATQSDSLEDMMVKFESALEDLEETQIGTQQREKMEEENEENEEDEEDELNHSSADEENHPDFKAENIEHTDNELESEISENEDDRNFIDDSHMKKKKPKPLKPKMKPEKMQLEDEGKINKPNVESKVPSLNEQFEKLSLVNPKTDNQINYDKGFKACPDDYHKK